MQNPIFDKSTLEAAKKGDTEQLIKKLNSEERAKLDAILKDKSAIEALLKSPQAAAIIKAIGGKNG